MFDCGHEVSVYIRKLKDIFMRQLCMLEYVGNVDIQRF